MQETQQKIKEKVVQHDGSDHGIHCHDRDHDGRRDDSQYRHSQGRWYCAALWIYGNIFWSSSSPCGMSRWGKWQNLPDKN